MKGINYVAGVVKTYREAIDSLQYKPYLVKKQWLYELDMFSSRGYTTGMFLGKQDDNGYNHDDREAYRMSHELIGVVKSVQNGSALVALRNTIKVGDEIQFLSPGLENKTCPVSEIFNKEGSPLQSGRNDEDVVISIHPGVRENDLIRRSIRPGS
jgi:putative protease